MAVVWCKQLHWINGIKELSGKWLNNVVQQRSFVWRRGSHIFFIPCSANQHQTQYTLQCQMPQNHRKNTLYYVKGGAYINAISHRKLVHLNITIEIIAVRQIEQYYCHFTINMFVYLCLFSFPFYRVYVRVCGIFMSNCLCFLCVS
jgi:hypothetical protein